MKNADLPAMPMDFDAAKAADDGWYYQYAHGLTKREMFAMAAMQGLCANSIAGSHHAPDNLSKEAVMYADALLAELEKSK